MAKEFKISNGSWHVGIECKNCKKQDGERVWWERGYDPRVKICPKCGTKNSMKLIVVRYCRKMVKSFWFGWIDSGESYLEVK